MMSMRATQKARAVPIPSGSALPTAATTSPLPPICLSMARSTSRPASRTNNSRPTSPTRVRARGKGTTFSSSGPSTMPTTISPTRLGILTFTASLPTTHVASRKTKS